MPRDLQLANRLRAQGLTVVEVAGWQTRGSDGFSPRGSVDHHTAGPLNGNAPSLGIVINGRSDLAGPLCNVLLARDNTAYVVAAGRANHAGLGGWAGMSGNSTVYGVERENVGTSAEPWRGDQNEATAKVHVAFIQNAGSDASKVCRHQEWAPTRKIDSHDFDGNWLRTRVSELLGGPPAAPSPSPSVQWAQLATFLRLVVFGWKVSISKWGIGPNDTRSDVITGVQRAINSVIADPAKRLAENGIYDEATVGVVRFFQTMWWQPTTGIVDINFANRLWV